MHCVKLKQFALSLNHSMLPEIKYFSALRDVRCFRLRTKRCKHGQQWINTLRDYAFPKIGRMPVDSIGEPEVLMCLSPI